MALETIIGYDPGGDGAHGVALLSIMDGKPEALQTRTFQTTEQVIEYVEAVGSIDALGVDTMTCWSTGRGGWRPADRWLRERYTHVRNSVMTPNGLAGSMGLNGMCAVIESRRRRPDVVIVETHPKVLYWALTREKYDYQSSRQHMEQILRELLGAALSTANEHEWDAALSAIAAARGVRGEWTVDLHALPTEPRERLINPCGKTNYFWPES